MKADRRSLQFDLGFNQFLKVALDNARNPNNIPCPCLKCCNNRFGNIQFIKDLVYFNGIMENYTRWKWHGECSYAGRHCLSEGSETVEQIPDLRGNEDVGVLSDEDHEISLDSNEFMQFVEDGDKPLYPDCTKSTKMNGLVHTFNLKAKHELSDSCYTNILILFHTLLPDGNEVPGSVNLAKKTLSALGMKYEKIDACPNDYILYRDLNVDAKKCPSCNASRWKLAKDGYEKVGVSAKTLWGRKKDGMMRHPADCPTWKMVDTNWPDFGIEHRNLRLALSSDGFNPYGAVNSKYSCWPVILITYNLPPWLCMKRKYMMLTLLISGPKQPGNDIDVYLQPLVDDLKVLWDEIEEVYDSVRGEYFKLKAVLLWTINDFPAYGNLSGKDDAPTPLTREETFARVQGLPKASGKGNAPAPYKGPPENRPRWKKKSVFYDLDYWKFFLVRHNLDVMHIEKNCCDAILGTLLNILGKTKDGVASRLDTVDMGIRTDLKPTAGVKRDKLPLASWNLFVDERKIICNSFFHMKASSQFSSNIQNLVSVNDLKLGNLKSHDCHVIMQLLLPVAIPSVLEKPVRYAIIRFCLFFKVICSKVINVSILKQMQADLVDTICLLEKFFPPSFFNIMIHLTVHLVREVDLCGPVFFRWMYPFERYMKVFKGMVHNRTFLEGCIAECYIVEEAIEFLEERMLPEDATTIRIPKSSRPGLLNGCKRLSAPKIVTANGKLLDIAHLCILQNCEDVQPYFKEHIEFLELSFPYNINNPKWMKDKRNQTFPNWFKKRVANEIRIVNNEVPETIRWLVGGPNKEVPTFHGYHVNEVDFNTMERDSKRSVQNSGVFLVADAMQVASANDKRPTTVDMDFYGRIQQIWEVDYYKFRIPIFLCDLVESSRGIKVDELGFTLAKLDRIGHLNDPFVLATHVIFFFYIEDPLDAEWSVVVRCLDKDLKGGGGDDDDDDDEVAVADDDYYDEDDNIVVDQHPYILIMPPVESFDNVVGDEPIAHTLDQETASNAASPKKHTSPSLKKRKAGSDAASLKKRKGGSRTRKIASLKKRTSRRLNVTKSMKELEELGRYIFWIKARQDKDGKFLDVAVEEAVERIVNLQKMEDKRKFKWQGMKDVLTEALGNPEHRGRVRGVGGNVKPETYFDLPRRQRGRKMVSEEEKRVYLVNKKKSGRRK
ncbi:hypothetical protein ACLB2K_040601 [Fragaria x ananassa]